MVKLANFTLCMFYSKKKTRKKTLWNRVPVIIQMFQFSCLTLSDIELPVISKSVDIDPLSGNWPYVKCALHLMSSLLFVSLQNYLPGFKLDNTRGRGAGCSGKGALRCEGTLLPWKFPRNTHTLSAARLATGSRAISGPALGSSSWLPQAGPCAPRIKTHSCGSKQGTLALISMKWTWLETSWGWHAVRSGISSHFTVSVGFEIRNIILMGFWSSSLLGDGGGWGSGRGALQVMDKRQCLYKIFSIRKRTGQERTFTPGKCAILMRKIKRENSISFPCEICVN